MVWGLRAQVATVANEEFRRLYAVEDVDEYASLKASIFARYRLLAEAVGAHLLAVRGPGALARVDLI